MLGYDVNLPYTERRLYKLCDQRFRVEWAAHQVQRKNLCTGTCFGVLKSKTIAFKVAAIRKAQTLKL